jgi:endogenous inhibitor of DNA gyrase (YacG/DUF329 family)
MEGEQQAEWPEFPFCSARCRLIDLGRWLGEDYRLTTPAAEQEQEAPAQQGDDNDIP